MYLTLHNSQRVKKVLISLPDIRYVNVLLAICQICPEGKLLVCLFAVPVHLSALEAQRHRYKVSTYFLKGDSAPEVSGHKLS